VIRINSLEIRDQAFSFQLFTNHINMKAQQTTVSEVQLIYKSKVKASDRLQVKCSKDAYNLFMEHWNHDTIEHV
jgi:hypothetical protein